MRHRFGWKPDRLDFRDYTYSKKLDSLPEKVDMRDKCPPVFDQKELGSCTANATAAAVQFLMMKQADQPVITPSRLFIYYNQRVIEGTVNSDGGAELRTAIKEINKTGTCKEETWPYDIRKYKRKPPEKAYREAKETIAVEYSRLDRDLAVFKSCLAEGYPFILGIAIYEYFDSKEMEETGILKMPQKHEKMLDGHTCLVVGFNSDVERFIVMNSFGKEWGQHGFFEIPYEYLLNSSLADDFWVLKHIH